VIHTASLVDLSGDLPVVIEVVDDQEHVDKLVAILDEMVTRGALITMERVRVLNTRRGSVAYFSLRRPTGRRQAPAPDTRQRVRSGRPLRDSEVSVLRAWEAQPSCLKHSAPRIADERLQCRRGDFLALVDVDGSS